MSRAEVLMVNLKVDSIKRLASDSVTGDELKQEIEPEPEKHPSHVRMEGKDIRGDMEVFIVTSVVTSPDPESSRFLPEELSEPESSSVVPQMSESAFLQGRQSGLWRKERKISLKPFILSYTEP